MEAIRNLCLVLTLGMIGSVRSYINCTTAKGLLDAQSECFKAENLNIILPSYSEPYLGKQSVNYLDVILKQIPETVCTQQDQYLRALECVGGVFQDFKLSPLSPTWTLPQIVDKLCINDKNVKLECAASKFNEFAQCEFEKGIEIGLSGASLRDTLTFCKIYKALNDCQRSLYRSCGCATVRAYETIYLDIYYQHVCPQSVPSISRVLCDANNTSIFLNKGIFGPVNSNTHCTTAKGFLDAQSACFNAERLDIVPSTSTVHRPDQQAVNYMEVILRQIPHTVCTQQNPFRRALDCVGGVTQQCVTSYLSPTSTLSQIVDKLCIKDTNVKLECVATKFNDATQCDSTKGMKIDASGAASLSELICKVYKGLNDCQRSIYRSCGCATVRAYETIYLDIYYQHVCPQSLPSISRVLCDANNTSIFLNKGVGVSGRISVLTLSLLLAAVLFCYRIV